MKKPVLFLLMLLVGLVTMGADVRTAESAVDLGPVPVTKADATWGSAKAPATMVIFTDLQCPYCKRLHATVDELKKHYGPRQLRIVLKHHPLPFHKQARPAADAAVAVRSVLGERAFWRYIDEAFVVLQDRNNATGDYQQVLKNLGFNAKKINRRIRGGKPGKQVDADMALARKIGARGTPHSFINGVSLTGARPKADFVKVIDEQIAAARKLRRSGVAAKRVYSVLAKRNFSMPVPPKPSSPSAAKRNDTTAVWKVPIGNSPAKGPRNAPVTIVAFSDFQCPFCSRVLPTLETLEKRYGKQLRFVFKNQPLPFHMRAEPAAQLALEAFARRGHKGFWKAHDKLFANQKALDDADLEQYARDLGLNATLAMSAVRRHKYKRQIDADQALAGELNANGTPHFFVNGRRLTGAQPEQAFAEIIDEELAKAAKLRAKGVPASRIYAHIMKTAKEPPPPEKKKVAAPTKNNPVRGAKFARVTIQAFTDFQCPFCNRVLPTLERIEKEYRGRVRIVYRHMPLAFHKDAMPAHQAAAEAFRQGGNKAFWKMHDKIYADQKNLERADLTAHASAIGLDVGKFERALDTKAHAKTIEADMAVAKKAGITGTPAFVINDYYLSGAQPFSKFKKLIDRALRGK